MKILTYVSTSRFMLDKSLAGLLCLAVAFASAWLAVDAQAQQAQPNAQAPVQIRTIPIANGFYILAGRGVNVGVFAGEDGVVMVNAPTVQQHLKMIEAVSQISSKPIRYVINTDWHDPNTAGNALMAKLGATVVAHENVRKRLSVERFDPGNPKEKVPPVPKEGLPALTYTDSLTLHLGSEEIYIFHPETAHSDSDSAAYFRHANVLQTGDLYYSNNYPTIDLPSNGTINGMIAGLDRSLKLVNPETKVIPGRGPITGVKELKEYRDMFVTVRDRVLSGIRDGKTFDQIVATKPTAEFDEARKGNGELVVIRTGADFAKWFYDDLSKAVR